MQTLTGLPKHCNNTITKHGENATLTKLLKQANPKHLNLENEFGVWTIWSIS